MLEMLALTVAPNRVAPLARHPALIRRLSTLEVNAHKIEQVENVEWVHGYSPFMRF
jgi:hypothetical protein